MEYDDQYEEQNWHIDRHSLLESEPARNNVCRDRYVLHDIIFDIAEEELTSSSKEQKAPQQGFFQPGDFQRSSAPENQCNEQDRGDPVDPDVKVIRAAG